MNPVLADIYSTVLPSAPFIIGAYALVWLALLIYVVVGMRGLKKTEARIALLEEAVAAGAAGKPESSEAAFGADGHHSTDSVS